MLFCVTGSGSSFKFLYMIGSSSIYLTILSYAALQVTSLKNRVNIAGGTPSRFISSTLCLFPSAISDSAWFPSAYSSYGLNYKGYTL